MIHNFKSWQGWLLFGASMAVVFCLGLAVSALSERRAEVASIFNNRKNPMKGIVAQNEKFQGDFPREYQTWTETARTDFESEFNGNVQVDVLAQRPEMVILWAGYAFQKTMPLLVATCMPLKTFVPRCEQEHLRVKKTALSPLLAGPARVLMYRA